MVGETATVRRATIMEVARLAGVSHQTVSRYLRFDDGMKEATRQRIGAAIAELDYRPNLAARAMRTRRSGRVAILLPTGEAASSFQMLAGATRQAHEAGYEVEVVALGGSARERTDRMLELAGSGFFEGILSLTPLLPASRPEMSVGAPVVVSADYDEEMHSIGELADGSPVAELVEGLARSGHRRFLHVAGDLTYASARGRKEVYQEAIDRLGLESYGVVDGDWSAESGIDAVLDLPTGSGVTAIVAANDTVAAGVARGALRRGWRIPGDLSVSGWDNNPLGAYLEPTLTTVAVKYDSLGRRAMGRLVAVLQGRPAPVDDTDPISQVVWRDSTGPAPRPV